MSNDINLLSHQSKTRFSQEQILAYSKVAAIICSILTVSLALMLFLLNRDPTLSQLQGQQQTVLAELTILHSKTAKDLIILDRVKRIVQINQQRSSLGQKVTDIQKQLPSGISISSFTLDSKHVNLTITSSSLVPMGTFINNLTQAINNKTLLKQLTIQGIISDEKTGTYLLSITGDLL